MATTTIQKCGHSLAVRLPRAVAKQLHLHKGSSVTIRSSNGILKIQPSRKRFSLKFLLAKFKPAHRHPEWNRSSPRGREVI